MESHSGDKQHGYELHQFGEVSYHAVLLAAESAGYCDTGGGDDRQAVMRVTNWGLDAARTRQTTFPI